MRSSWYCSWRINPIGKVWNAREKLNLCIEKFLEVHASSGGGANNAFRREKYANWGKVGFFWKRVWKCYKNSNNPARGGEIALLHILARGPNVIITMTIVIVMMIFRCYLVISKILNILHKTWIRVKCSVQWFNLKTKSNPRGQNIGALLHISLYCIFLHALQRLASRCVVFHICNFWYLSWNTTRAGPNSECRPNSNDSRKQSRAQLQCINYL